MIYSLPVSLKKTIGFIYCLAKLQNFCIGKVAKTLNFLVVDMYTITSLNCNKGYIALKQEKVCGKVLRPFLEIGEHFNNILWSLQQLQALNLELCMTKHLLLTKSIQALTSNISNNLVKLLGQEICHLGSFLQHGWFPFLQFQINFI